MVCIIIIWKGEGRDNRLEEICKDKMAEGFQKLTGRHQSINLEISSNTLGKQMFEKLLGTS